MGIITLTVLGLGLMSKGLYWQGKAVLAQYLIANAWQQSLQTQQNVKPWFYADTYPVAQLVVPTHAKQQYVLANADLASLAFGPAVFQGGASLAEQGASLIAAHNDSHFSFLADLSLGTVIKLQLSDAQWRDFVVTQVQVIDQYDTSFLLQKTDKKRLYLATCYPFNSVVSGTKQRFVVTTEQI
ncbi:sortase A [Pseudoalteromonas ulvae UL12]|uniref:Sortase, marine proteobacterial type n=1 Tax=Pseudoalteromonas ulvae TaxID=107327 RepID=A0A244CQ90_PSEDV|nr:class GN sortase [Pseudoalteromonas ulvae]MBE0365254.1 sortase A [Pseudoalteromonas ulvae UL12]OUL57790.1 sortase, marine proteobacterial type [Pseudoalteromonas ulvae]